MSFGEYMVQVIPNIALVLLGGIALYVVLYMVGSIMASISRKRMQRKAQRIFRNRGF